MRRNPRLDWRALALLGAFLSICIEWPSTMYAMPVILAPENYFKLEQFSRSRFHERWKHFKEPIDHHSIKKAIAIYKHNTSFPVTLKVGLNMHKSHFRIFKRSLWRNSSKVERERGKRNSFLVAELANSADNVHRSSDVTVFSKATRLIYTRHPLSSHKSNLDRNERSTLSHLSGPSRKIQLFIKNRFVQLMPDGTVNGTQDDQSEYSEYWLSIFSILSYLKSFLFS